MKYNKIALIDLEMCCWERSPTGEIIEIGVAELDLETHDIKKHQYYVKPQNDTVSDYCTTLTGITHDTIKRHGKPLNEVLSAIIKKHGSANKIYGGWGSDDNVLYQECIKKGLSSPIKNYIDISMLYFMGKSHTGNRPNLKECIINENIPFDGTAHSGVDDAYNLALLTDKMMRKLK